MIHITTTEVGKSVLWTLSLFIGGAVSCSPHRISESLAAAPTFAGRLTVRPHDMATGTETVQAGIQRLDSLPGYLVYVPQSCVGKRRVPLVVYLHGGGLTGASQLKMQRPLADKYGMILLLPTALPPSWDAIYRSSYGGHAGMNPTTIVSRTLTSSYEDVRAIDAAIKYVLRTDAIDPDKIAVVGFSDGGSYALFLGRNNENVFSRVAGMSAFEHFDGSLGTRNPHTQFFVSGGIAEGNSGGGEGIPQALSVAQDLRNEGHHVETVLGLRPHAERVPDHNYMWSWLAHSWSWPLPDGTLEPVPYVLADSDPVLTVDAVNKMTAFWTRFRAEPDSILKVGRTAHQEAMILMIGQTPVTVIKANIPALAAKYPSVAADLKAAGLTPEEEDAYRAAIIRVGFTRFAEQYAGTVSATSVLAKNMAFRQTHSAEFQLLANTKMWTTQ